MPSARRHQRAARVQPAPSQTSLFPELVAPPRVHPAIRLTEANVARTVPPRRAGVFFFKTVAPGGRVEERVGRDDRDVRKHLLTRAGAATDNVLFGWIEARDPIEAFQFECLLWHAQGGGWARLDEIRHPEAPEETPWLVCPECRSAGAFLREE